MDTPLHPYPLEEPDFTPVPLPLPHGGSKIPPLPIRSADEKHLATLLHLCVLRSGIPIRQMAKDMGISYNALYQYINGKKRNPTLAWMHRFLDACDAKLVIVFDQEDQNEF
jgi:DNA-binding phage protein